MKIRCCQCWKVNSDGKMEVGHLDVSIIAKVENADSELMNLVERLNSFSSKGKIEITNFAKETFINGSVIVDKICQSIVNDIADRL